MINIFEYLNPARYKVIQDADITRLHHVENGMANQEKFISLEEKTEHIAILIHNRDKISNIANFNNKNDALGLTIILCYKYFEAIAQCAKCDIDEIREASSHDDINKIIAIIRKDCKEECFSILEVKEKSICMVKNLNSFDVYLKYGDETKEIVNDCSLFRASIITRNYAKFLEAFNEIFSKIASRLSSENEFYRIFLEYYLF